MKNNPVLLSLFAALALMSASNATATLVPVTVNQLPQPIQDCAFCLFPGSLTPDFSHPSGTMRAFNYQDFTGLGVENRYLIQYELFPLSGQTTHQYNPETETFNDSQESFGNFVWLDVPAILDPGTDPHRLLLYSEQITPSTSFYSPGVDSVVNEVLPPFTKAFHLTTADMMDGSAFFQVTTDTGPNNVPQGDLQAFDTSALILDVKFDLLLNLVHLDYSSALLAFTTDDSRATLFFERYDDMSQFNIDSFTTSLLSIQQVPLPAAVWLMLGGLSVLASTGRRRKSGAGR